MFGYLEQEVLFNMMQDKAREAFYLFEPVLATVQRTVQKNNGGLNISFIGIGVLVIMGVLAFVIFRMAQNEKKARREMEDRRNRADEE